jgi:hypothetical protein
MRPTHCIAVLAALATSVSATDYFFRFIGGNPTIHNQRLRLNNSITLGVTEAPYNPSDHFSRLRIAHDNTDTMLTIVPTNPHPPPIPGYYVLDGSEDVEDAERLIMSYRVSEGNKYRYTKWEVKEDEKGRKFLRYNGENEKRWIAKQETTYDGIKRWVLYWVRPTKGNMRIFSTWEYNVVHLELVKAKGPVNSSAPGGVTEP